MLPEGFQAGMVRSAQRAQFTEEVAGGVVTRVSLAAANDLNRPEDREKGSPGRA